MKADTYKPLPIVRAVRPSIARQIVQQFMAGSSPLYIARQNGYSRSGVEELIRTYTRTTRTKGHSR